MRFLYRHTIGVEDFEAAALPHMADLYRYASLLVGDRVEAEDLVQEVYLEAWKSFHRFEPGTNCRAWLFSILFHHLHHLRRKQAKRSHEESVTDLARQEQLASEPPVAQEIRDEDVLKALEKVPVEFREVVLLADVEEFSYREIAEALKVPVGTVMSRLSRGRKLLRRELADIAKAYGIASDVDGKVQGEPA